MTGERVAIRTQFQSFFLNAISDDTFLSFPATGAFQLVCSHDEIWTPAAVESACAQEFRYLGPTRALQLFAPQSVPVIPSSSVLSPSAP